MLPIVNLGRNWTNPDTETAKTLSLLLYRPQRSCGQGNIFSPVCHSVHKGEGWWWYPRRHWGRPPRSRHPLGADTPPWEQTGADNPRSRHLPWEQTAPRGADTPPEQTPPGADTPLGSRHPPGADPPRADPPPRIRSTSGRYASYWNAFLFEKNCNYLSSKLALILIIDLIAALLSETFVFRGVCSAVVLLEKPSVKKTIP